MKNFDAERAERESRDRTFRMAGRDFRFRAAIGPEDFAEYTDLVSGRLHTYERIPIGDSNGAALGERLQRQLDEVTELVEKREAPTEDLLARIKSMAEEFAQAGLERSDAKADPRSKGKPKEKLVVVSGPTEAESVAILDRTIEAFLVPEYRETWREARADKDVENPITSGDMYDLIGYMWEVVTGRPTEPDSDSSSGSAANGTRSTPESPSPEAQRSTA